MSIINPTQLVDEFKKTGEFDRLRRELLTQFRSGDSYTSFISRVEDVARQKLTSDNKVKTLPETSMVKELMQDLNRYPIIERAVSEMQETALSDPEFTGRVRAQAKKILKEDCDRRSGTDDNSKSSSHNPSAVTTTVSSANAQALESQNAVVSKSDLQIEVSEAADGNESDDSAMIESPVSETPQNEDKTPFD